MLLTLLRGRARKSAYFEKLLRSSSNAILVQLGQNVNSWGSFENWIVDRVGDDDFELEIQLQEIFADVLNSKYDHLFIYANFTLEEIEVLIKVVEKSHPRLDVTVTVQDNNVSDGQLIIEEIHI